MMAMAKKKKKICSERQPGLVPLSSNFKFIDLDDYTDKEELDAHVESENAVEMDECALADLLSRTINSMPTGSYPEFVADMIIQRNLLGGGPVLQKLEWVIVNYVIAPAPIGADQQRHLNENLVASAADIITRRRLMSLWPGKWVGGECMNTVAHMKNLDQQQRGNWCHWYFPTFTKQYVDKGYEASSVSWNIRDWKKYSFVKCERIYIPMNEKSQHWYLLVIAADQRHVYVIDTLKYNTSVRKRDVDRMIEFVQALVDMDDSVDFVDDYKIIWKQDRVINWPVVSPHYVPNQVEMDDGDNCGVYVIHFMQVPSEIPFITLRTVVTANHRFVLMASLILWRENSLRAKVMQLAFAHLTCKIPT